MRVPEPISYIIKVGPFAFFKQPQWYLPPSDDPMISTQSRVSTSVSKSNAHIKSTKKSRWTWQRMTASDRYVTDKDGILCGTAAPGQSNLEQILPKIPMTHQKLCHIAPTSPCFLSRLTLGISLAIQLVWQFEKCGSFDGNGWMTNVQKQWP